jgi:hypothetical protein
MSLAAAFGESHAAQSDHFLRGGRLGRYAWPQSGSGSEIFDERKRHPSNLGRAQNGPVLGRVDLLLDVDVFMRRVGNILDCWLETMN